MARELTPAAAAELVRPADTMAIPLGPGAPAAFLHTLGERDDWQHLQVFGGLLLDLYALFTKPGVQYLSGFFGPAERVLRDMGAPIEFVPADFRRFATLAQQLAPRIMTTVATPPDEHGNMSLSLHTGATVAELFRAAADPDRILLVETSEHLPRTFGIPPQFPHAIHVDQADIIVARRRGAVPARRRAGIRCRTCDRRPCSGVHLRRRHAADRHRRRPVHRRRAACRGRGR